ncbi:MAG: choice-of-anchor D domain-containing protein [Rudaea sp.]
MATPSRADAPRSITMVPLRERALRALVMLAAAVALLAFAPSPAHGQPALRPLLLPATAADTARYARDARHPEAGVVRQMPVQLDLAALDAAAGAPGTLRVDLFDGRVLTVQRAHVEQRGPADFTWQGTLPGHARGFALLTVVGGQVSGMLDTGEAAGGGHRYVIQSTDDGLTLLHEIDPAAFPEDHPGGGEPVAPHAGAKSALRGAIEKPAGDASAKADSGATIDVMVVYSNQTAAAAGSTIGTQIQHAIDTANLVYANSGIATRLRLVHYERVAYDESGDFPTDLSRLTNGSDGFMDNVQSLRDTYGADLVSLFVENGQYCGYGWIGPSASYAFSVVNRGCASANYSFPHELGHNFGARHDTYVDASTTPYAYGHGWVDVAQAWRDVMAYNNACAAAGVSCVRIGYFSTPSLTYGGDPLGSASTADVVRVHNGNAVTVANFRPAGGTVSSPCTYALSPTSASVPAGGASGSTALTTASGCAWTASSSASWLAITSATSGSGSATVSYAASANGGGARSANLSIGGQTFLVTQSATVTVASASMSLSPTSIGFGTVQLGKTSGAKTATLSNTGSDALTIDSIAIGGANPADFAWNGTCGINASLAAGQSCTLSVTFKPLATGPRQAALSVATSSGSGSVALSGSGKKSGRK